jgi:hypothetical protein
MRLQVKPIPLRVANEYIAKHHPHHGHVRGCKFSVGAVVGDLLVGVVTVERPKAWHLDDGWTLEFTRVCADHDPRIAPMLIDAATRAAFAMGARYVLAHTLPTDDGAPYRAAGWRRMEANGKPIELGVGEWARPSRRGTATAKATGPKHRWERYNPAALDTLATAA